jgi:hypothetical protein
MSRCTSSSGSSRSTRYIPMPAVPLRLRRQPPLRIASGRCMTFSTSVKPNSAEKTWCATQPSSDSTCGALRRIWRTITTPGALRRIASAGTARGSGRSVVRPPLREQAHRRPEPARDAQRACPAGRGVRCIGRGFGPLGGSLHRRGLEPLGGTPGTWQPPRCCRLRIEPNGRRGGL